MSAPETEFVEVMVEAAGWQGANLPALAPHALGAGLDWLVIPRAGVEIAVLGCDDARIAALNGRFRGRRCPTNVLSWPARALPARADGAPPPLPVPEAGAPLFLGDIAIAHETCAREARAQGLTVAAHAQHLLVHGLLHLLGHDHERAGDGALMEAREAAVLARMGLPDPYLQEAPAMTGAAETVNGR